MTTPLPPDTLLQDRYRVVELIGLGGMGAVYLTEDLHLRAKQFALKEIQYSLDPNSESSFTGRLSPSPIWTTPICRRFLTTSPRMVATT